MFGKIVSFHSSNLWYLKQYMDYLETPLFSLQSSVSIFLIYSGYRTLVNKPEKNVCETLFGKHFFVSHFEPN